VCFCSQVNVINVEELDVFHEQAVGLPLLIRVWAQFARNDYVGPALPSMTFEGQLSCLASPSYWNGLFGTRKLRHWVLAFGKLDRF
jgi:hypothetical protein